MSNKAPQTLKLKKVSVNLGGHSTSFSIEAPFLEYLKAMAQNRHLSFAALVAEIDKNRPQDINLSSALRLAAFDALLKA